MRSSLLIICILLVAGCSDPDVQSAADLNSIYEQALLETAGQAVLFDTDSEAEIAALGQLQDFFASMTAASVTASAAQVYAPDALLYDNVVALRGQPVIQEYFVKAAADVDELKVEFMHVAKADNDYYIRWKMTIVSDKIGGGAPLVSYGVTQFRFDAQGRVLLHRDFWDASTGLYEYLPVAGGWLQRLRAMLGGHANG